MNNQNLQNESSAFTIIEVLLVLAIAGLIIMLVFIAVPALKRNARNYERKQIVSNIAAQMGEHFTNSQLFPDETTAAGRQEMCRIIQEEITDMVGKVQTCDPNFHDNGDGHDCIGGVSDRGYQVCFLQSVGWHNASGGAHTYVGPYDEIDLETGHWCFRPNELYDPSDYDPLNPPSPLPIVTSDTTGYSNKVISVRTKLENNIPFCQDFGAPKK